MGVQGHIMHTRRYLHHDNHHSDCVKTRLSDK